MGGMVPPLAPSKVVDGIRNRDPNEKDFSISFLMSRGKSWENILTELDKCDLVCANCHREIHEVHHVVKNNTPKTSLAVTKSCKNCNKSFTQSKKLAGYCSQACHKLDSRKAERPAKDDLIDDVNRLGYTGAGRKYGVSDNAIRKWMRNY